MNQKTDAPVSANDVLPYDILSEIFLESLSSWYEPYTKEIVADRRIEAATIRRASQVCQYWRAVTLATPKLWGTIINVDFEKALWIQELLRRSGNSPLIVQSRTSFDRTDEGFQSQKWALLFNEMHRIRILHLTVPWNSPIDFQIIEDALNKPAPLMESVKIVPQYPPGCRPPATPFLDLPNYLFAAQTPKLREVVTRGAGLLPRVWLPSTKLVSLSVSTENGETFYPPSSWLDLLKDQPQMQYLSLSSLQFDQPRLPVMPANHRSVSLPNLEYLSLRANQDFCNQFLPKIVVPTSCLLGLDSIRNMDTLSDINGTIRWLTTYFKGWKKEEKCLVWSICVVNRLQLLLSAYEDEYGSPIASISLCVEPEQVDIVVVAIFGVLQEMNLLQEVDSLRLRFYHPVSPDTRTALTSLLESCNQARKMTLRGLRTAKALLDTILRTNITQPTPGTETSIDSNNSPTIPNILLPNVDTLILDEVDYQEEYDDVSDFLFNFLRWRRDVGRKIPNLSIRVPQPEDVQFMHKAHPDLDLDLVITKSEHRVAGDRYKPQPCIV